MSMRKSFDSATSERMGARIREIRGEKTQAEFAVMVGVDRATLSNYEKGRRQPNNEVIERIAKIGKTTVARLIFGETATPFDTYQSRIDAAMAEAIAKRPGFIPRWYVSQDELDVVFALRLMFDDRKRLSLIEQIVALASANVESERSIYRGQIPPYGEAVIERLKTALEDGQFEEGFDPDMHYWATLAEEINR